MSLTLVLSTCGGGGGSGSTPSPLPGITLGGTGNDIGRSVQQTADGGYIIAAYTNSRGTGSYEAYLIKTDPTGSVTQTKTFSGTSDDLCFSIKQTQDGGYIATGVYVNLNGGSPPTWAWGYPIYGELYLRKMDADLNTTWEIATAGTYSYTMGYAVQQTSDKGYIVAGAAAWNPGGAFDFLLKTDATGTILWTAGSGMGQLATGVRQTGDGGFIVSSSGGLIKTDPTGSVIWTAALNVFSTESVSNVSDGGYIATGITASSGDVFLAKVDTSGSILWEKTFGSPGGDIGHSVQETSDHGFIIAGAGSGGTYNGGFDVYLIKTDKDGNLQWQKYYGGLGEDSGLSIQQTSDGGYIIVGSTTSKGAGGYDIYLIKTDANGNVQW